MGGILFLETERIGVVGCRTARVDGEAEAGYPLALGLVCTRVDDQGYSWIDEMEQGVSGLLPVRVEHA